MIPSTTIRILFLVVLCIAILNSLIVHAQPSYKTEILDIPNADPLVMVSCIYQDSKGFMWFGSYNGLHRYDGYELVSYRYDPKDSTTIGDNKISAIIEDSKGNLWIGTQNGLNYFDVKLNQFIRFDYDDFGIPKSVIGKLMFDLDDELWVTSSKGLYRKASDSLEFKFLKSHMLSEDSISRAFGLGMDGFGNIIVTEFGKYNLINKVQEKVQTLYVGSDTNLDGIGNLHPLVMNDGKVILGTFDGLWEIYYSKNEQLSAEQFESTVGHTLIPIAQVDENTLIVIGAGGIFLYNVNDDSHQKIEEGLNLALGDMLSFFYSKVDKILWIGAIKHGVVKIEFRNRDYTTYKLRLFDIANSPSIYFNLVEYSLDKLILPDLKKKLTLLDVNTGNISEFPNRELLKELSFSNWPITFYKSSLKDLWIGTSSDIYKVDLLNESVESISENIPKLSLYKHYIRELIVDSKNTIWATTWSKGVFKIDEENQSASQYFNDENSKTEYYHGGRSLLEDSKGYIWIGTRGGLHRYNPETDSFKTFKHDPKVPTSISVNTAFDIYEDSKGFIWLGTYGGGLNKFDPQDETFQAFTNQDGLIGNTVFSVLPDKDENLWLLSYNGLTKFNTNDYSTEIFNTSNGLGGDEYDAFFYGQSEYSGKIFIGGRHGIDVFHPDSIRKSDFKPNIVFTDFQLFNQTVPICKNNADKDEFCLDQSINYLESIDLAYDHKVFSISYAAMDYESPENIDYAYQLVGFDDDWQIVEKQRTVTYTNLDPGKYVFNVKSTNSDKIWNESPTALTINISPPWWKTNLAYLAYLFAVGIFVTAAFRFQKRRLELNAQLQFEKNEAGRLKELDLVKTNLYNNITHEFRTPLTVILGQSRAISEELTYAKKSMIRSKLNTIERNGINLLELVNQMLDLSKMEAGFLKLNLIQDDIVLFIKYILESFHSYAKVRQVGLTYKVLPSKLIMDYDPDRIQQILSNLMTNAIKFTNEGGCVEVESYVEDSDDETNFIIKVNDSGIGIAQEQLPFIFDRFYQVDSEIDRRVDGTGIGLAFVKELVELMNGALFVKSELDKGSEFIFSLPIKNAAKYVVKPKEQINSSIVEKNITSIKEKSDQDAPIILIVDDNHDVREYIHSCLPSVYQIITASNGKEGIEMAIKYLPDIIVSDVMMPEVDGFEMCSAIKQDQLTNHIPIIMLTAKATNESKVEGLQFGADVYMTKPFMKKELVVRIENLLKLQTNIQEHFKQVTSISEDTRSRISYDPYLLKVKETIEEHIDNPNLKPDVLAKLLFISASQLNRKLKSLTGKPTGQFIHSVRLAKAKELLKSTNLSVSQIAFDVGYKEHATFSTLFKREFGVAPSSMI